VKRPVTLRINGRAYDLVIAPQATLLEVLREGLGLTGSKEACDGGECGACTVLCDGEATLSCLLLAHEAEGREIITIEGLSQEGVMTDVQKAFVAEGAIQCGFCTPGMILSATALLNRKGRPSREEIKQALAGNLCRCTGYTKIVAAVAKAAETQKR
jgi:carbon-monoxide dehydrogenase small subunit